MVPCTLYTTQALLLLATHVRSSMGWVISGLGSSNTRPNLIGWSISQLIANQKGWSNWVNQTFNKWWLIWLALWIQKMEKIRLVNSKNQWKSSEISPNLTEISSYPIRSHQILQISPENSYIFQLVHVFWVLRKETYNRLGTINFYRKRPSADH